MAAARLGELKQFVSEALWTELAERDKHVGPAGPVREGPPWPYVSGDKIAAQKSRGNYLRLLRSRKQFVRRLQRIRYPYQSTAKTRRSFYSHVRGFGLLTFLRSTEFLYKVRRAWFFHRHYELEKDLFDRKQSQDGYPLVFHRDIMREISKHWDRIVTIAGKHGVPKEQFAEHKKAIQKQLLVEASVCCPELQRWFKRASRIRPHSCAVEMRLEIFDAIQAELAKRKMKNDELAYQLTALICSGRSSIRERLLDPTPDVVRLSVKNRKNSLQDSTEKARQYPTKENQDLLSTCGFHF